MEKGSTKMHWQIEQVSWSVNELSRYSIAQKSTGGSEYWRSGQSECFGVSGGTGGVDTDGSAGGAGVCGLEVEGENLENFEEDVRPKSWEGKVVPADAGSRDIVRVSAGVDEPINW